MADIKTILENLGYHLQNDGGKYYRAKPLYRDSGNRNSLRVSKKSGWFTDFGGDGVRGSITDLVALTLGLKTLDAARQWLNSNQYNLEYKPEQSRVLVESVKYYPDSAMERLIPNYDYWVGRGVSVDTLKKAEGGIATVGFMDGRYVFPIRNKHGKIVGFAGRDITGKKQSKWKLCGPKSHFVFPYSNLAACRKKSSIILVESIGDALALMDAGVDTALCLFGINLSDTLLGLIAGMSPKKVLVSLNNDGAENGNVGERNAEKILLKLQEYLNEDVACVALPTGKDFGEMKTDDIYRWMDQYGIN